MKCPIDQTDLQMTERQGIEIDYCPTCRGVWLDRGELDKIVERGSSYERPAQAQSAQPVPSGMPVQGGIPAQGAPQYRRRDDDWDDDDDDRYERSYQQGQYGQQGQYPPKKKKRGFLGELFDFD